MLEDDQGSLPVASFGRYTFARISACLPPRPARVMAVSPRLYSSWTTV